MAKKIVFISLLIVLFAFPTAVFSDTGIGGIAGYGQPSGLSLKFNDFPVVSLGWSLSANWVEGTIDNWFVNDRLGGGFLWYLGGGVKASIGSQFGLGLRLPIGLQWYFMPRFELFGELVPGYSILPSMEFDFSGGIGLRFHI